MDYKKVASIEFGGEYFQAEFNDAFFTGDVSGLTGVFAGSFTANALDVANTANIAGNAIAVASGVVVSRYPSSGYLPEGGTRTIINLTIDAPAAYVGVLHFEATLYNGDNDHSQFNFDFTRTILQNGSALFSKDGNLGQSYTTPQREVSRMAVSLTQGQHTFAVTHNTGSGSTTPYGYYRDIKLSVYYFKR